MKKNFSCVDLFCGGGGTSTGMIEAFRKAGANYTLVGINHWQIAIDTNKRNHDGQWLCASVNSIDPTDVIPSGRLDFLWASPECTNHSRAKGGKPRANQSRCQPEMLLSWIRKLIVRRMYVENVPDFLDWGPLLAVDTVIDGKLYKAGQPDPRRKGVLFRDWIESVKRSGYKVDWRIMNAADYGAATCRERLIVQAVRLGTGERIIWPEQTHSRTPDLFIHNRWIPAKEIIDWSIKGESIFKRKHPLAENTLRRIENGIRKYWGKWAEPFLVVLRGTSDVQMKCTARPVSQPLPTLSAGGGHVGLVEPLLTHYHGGEKSERRISSEEETLPTCDCSNRYGLVEGFIIDMAHTKNNVAAKSVNSPMNTITCTHGTHGLVDWMCADARRHLWNHPGGRWRPLRHRVPWEFNRQLA
ncbi:MAG: DNA cytosine methyltransferase [Victivallales bacterium]|nr:DNA cytosine methyltransferase [Victivallales bacterium]